MADYSFTDIEKKWQKYWEENQTFLTTVDPDKPKYYILDMFPYPSGAGLHVGHPLGYTATDIVARYKKMKGFNVLHPMGWDAFGLPAEQYAIETGTQPAITTQKNCDNFRRQIKSLGMAYDWDREVNTTDPDYFKWTQWIFTRLYDTWFDEEQKKGRPIKELSIPAEISQKGDTAVREFIARHRLAYYDDAQVWYCSNCKIVCANEEVLTDGTHEKCGNDVTKRNLKQWMLRIPLYAERLLEGLDSLDWPVGIKDMQKNWIGKSTGAEVDFQIEGNNKLLRVFTTRPDTLFGATYMVLAPEHEFVQELTTSDNKKAVEDYIRKSALKSDLDRTDLAKEKTGVFTGSYAINPINNNKIPIWIADYVLMGYGTGAIMAVPSNDLRDFEFANTFSLPIIPILDPDNASPEIREGVLNGQICWEEDGVFVNSSNQDSGLDINGLRKEEGIARTIEWLEGKELGISKVNYKMRDWLFSRQRYWGEPFPVIHWEDGEIEIMEDADLPLLLPEMEDYKPGADGESALANATDWLKVSDANGRQGRRETNTMPQWAGSCWYYLRYIDPHNLDESFSKEAEAYWMPVDLYIGGAEHAVLHLLYSRFWHKVLFDLGIVSTDEPYSRLFNQGMILAFAYETASGSKVTSDLVEERENKYYHTKTGEELKQIVAKMSKSLKNVINPDDVIAYYGADSLRLYLMFMGPLEATKPWDEQGVKGVFGFLARVYRFFTNKNNIREDAEDQEITKALHQTIKKVGQDIENLRFNTAISQMMIFTNTCIKKGKVTKDTAGLFAKVIAPFAPHLAEEIWEGLDYSTSVTLQKFPDYNEDLLREDVFEYPVSFNGKLRFKLELPLNMETEEIEKHVLEHESSRKWLNDGSPKKIIIVKGKIINVVV
ncbi:leucine--tRNA ligase [Bacteroidota bacterium]